MFAQALLNPIPKVLIDDRRMLAFRVRRVLPILRNLDLIKQLRQTQG